MSQTVKTTLDDTAYAFVKRQADLKGKSESYVIALCVTLTMERLKGDARLALEALRDVQGRIGQTKQGIRDLELKLSQWSGYKEISEQAVRQLSTLRDRLDRLEYREIAILDGTIGELAVNIEEP